jgi:Double-stranded DNA deaminase toxin A
LFYLLYNKDNTGWPDERLAIQAQAALIFDGMLSGRMRRDGIMEGELVSNNIVCGNRGYDNDRPMTCETYLSSILKRDSRLTVWATQDGGRTWWTKTYIGTGEGIKP